MRFLTFLPLYAGVLFCASALMPVGTAPRGSGISVPSLEPFPTCWRLRRRDHYTGALYYDSIALERVRARSGADSSWSGAVYDRLFQVAWAPAQGDSFDIALHHQTLRFARVTGPTVGYAYETSSGSLVLALLAEPTPVNGEGIVCPRSGGAR
jgi:hypothetical protein